MARIPRENGSLGISSPLDLANWRLRVLGPNGGYKPRIFTIEEIKALPRVEMTTELRCIEGWSEVVYWAGRGLRTWPWRAAWQRAGGQRLASPRRQRLARATSALETPDRYYYVGLDMASALASADLARLRDGRLAAHSRARAPLRLVIPVKYGIKSI